MKFSLKILLIVFPFLFGFQGNGIFLNGQNVHKDNIPQLENPITELYLKSKLRKSHPRLVLNSSIERDLKNKIKSDKVARKKILHQWK